MPTDPAEGFADNWTYLKTELNWLDRVLMMAVARQRKETKEIDRIAQSKADRATSHWWKGLVSLEGNIAHDEYRQPVQQGEGIKISYQQQLEAQIRASHKRGVVLALPALCDRLKLSLFEKNLVLMSLAPEVNRRYARLYRFLEGEDAAVKTDLPSLDLVLRLLCRNDQEWRFLRNRLAPASPLISHKLLQLLPASQDTLLNCVLKLAEALVTYLIAERPTAQDLEELLQPTPSSVYPVSALLLAPTDKRLLSETTAIDWSDLILPAPLLDSLKYLGQQIQGYAQAEKLWGIQTRAYPPGVVALFAGDAGTGKTMAAAAIAHSLQSPLTMVDLAQVEPEEYEYLLQTIATQAPKVLLIKSAQLWLGRSALLSAAMHQFLANRCAALGITLWSVRQQASVQLQWQRQMHQVLRFNLPNADDRLQLWQRAFPSQVPLNADMDWEVLSKQLALSGGEIKAIAQETVVYAAAIGATQIEMSHIAQVLMQRGKKLTLRSSKSKRSKSKTKRSIALPET